MDRGRQLLVIAGVAITGAAIYLAAATETRSRPARTTPAEVERSTRRAIATPPPRLANPDEPSPPTRSRPDLEPVVTTTQESSSPATDAEQAAILDWIERHRAEWVATCWRPPGEGRALPARATFRLRAVFEPDGRLRAYRIGGDPQLDVAHCLESQPFDPPFTGRGVRVDLAVAFELP